MSLLRTIAHRIRGFFARTNEAQLDDELRFHLEMETEENLRRGMTPRNARQAARHRFGPVAAAKENYRDRRGLPMLDDLGRDIRYAVRSLAKSPGFTLFAALSLALGLGANIAIFNVFDAVILKALPVPNPEDLRVISTVNSRGPSRGFSHPEFRELRDAAAEVAEVFGVAGDRPIDVRFLDERGTPNASQAESVRMQMVSGNFFTGAKVGAVAGRLFSRDDDVTPGAHPVAVLSGRFWKARFDGDPAVVGSEFRLNTTVFTIVGVAELGFHGLDVGELPDLWLPMAMQTQIDPGRSTLNSRNHSWIRLMARLRPGASQEALRTVLELQVKRSSEAMARTIQNPGIRNVVLSQRVVIEPGAKGFDSLRSDLSESLFVLLGLSLLVLLVACANVANLLLVRAATREREIAVRLSLGASRLRMARQLLTESGVLIAAGMLCGAGVAWCVHLWLTQVVQRVVNVTIIAEPDVRLLIFTVSIAVSSMCFVGLAPAWRPARNSVASTLKDGASSVTASREHVWFRKVLVVFQVASSVILLIGATLLARSLYNLVTMDTGFDRENVITMAISPRNSGYAIPRVPDGSPDQASRDRQAALARLRQLYERLESSILAVPGVRSVGYTDCGFLTGCNSNRCCMVIPGLKLEDLKDQTIRMDLASPDYFRTSGVRILLGRGFTEADHDKAAKVGILNETAARELFGDENPIGQEISWQQRPNEALRIVGVVADSKYADLREKTPRFLFTPFDQELPDSATLYVRSFTAPAIAIPKIRAAIEKVEPDLRVERVLTAEQHVERAVVRERIVSELCVAFTALALLLAAIGLYGVMAFQVYRRTGEFGIRMALGAQRIQILWGVLRESLGLGLAGVAIGVGLACVAARALSSLLYGVQAWDPATMLLAALVVAGVAFFAGFIPARKASGVDPAIALRYE